MTIRAQDILQGLGGSDNILEIEPCVTRMRVIVADEGLLDPTGLRHAGCHGVVQRGAAVQLVLGPRADALAAELGDLTWHRTSAEGESRKEPGVS
ncbi:MAG: PTS transporter subunit EIIB [Micrococcales bacterium]|nr:PTS transporter subunit EIIB [Micrococcales bacterium]